MIENSKIEFKSKLNDTLEKEVVAFLNSKDGGLIYIGIDDNGRVLPLENLDGLQLSIKDRLKNNISSSIMGLFDVLVENIDSQDIIKIVIASGSEKPYFIKKREMSEKGYFIRLGSASEPMNSKMIEEMFAKRVRNSLSKIESPRLDLTFEQLKIYYSTRDLKLNNNFAKSLELLNKDKAYNYIAYLMADENNISIKVAKYNGIDRVDLAQSNEYGYCSLIKASKAVLDKLEIENTTFTKITDKERIQTYLWDKVALREAVINAIIHNDYSNEIPPKFEIFKDRLEITSAGSLPIGISEDDFFEGISHPKNKEIMRIFKDLALVEQLGSGIPRIIKAYQKDSFKFMDNFTRVTFYKGGQIDLTDRQRDILNLIKENPKISRKKKSDILEINQSAVLKHLDILKEKNRLARVGGTRGYWEVL